MPCYPLVPSFLSAVWLVRPPSLGFAFLGLPSLGPPNITAPLFWPAQLLIKSSRSGRE